MGFVKISLRVLPVLTICFCLCFASVGSLQAQTLEQLDTNQNTDQPANPNLINPTINKGQIGEQLATCAAYAMIMEQVSITDMAIRDIWHDRFITLSRELKGSYVSPFQSNGIGKRYFFHHSKQFTVAE